MSELLRDLVAIPSESGQEGNIADFVAERVPTLGGTAIRLGNSIAAPVLGEDHSRALFINGHIDTVPLTDRWITDPYQLTADLTDEDRLIGLGSSDMKSGIALMMAHQQETVQQPPPFDIWYLYSAEEETTGAGTERLLQELVAEWRKRYSTTGCLILEPTNADYVGIGHRGSTYWAVTAEREGGHSSQDFGGEQAIEALHNFTANVLPMLRREWAEYTDLLLGSPTINATVSRAGETRNVVPGVAMGTYNIRVTRSLLPELERIRAGVAAAYNLTITQHEDPTPALCDPESHIYRTARVALPTVRCGGFQGATDMPGFEAYGISTLILGPGDPKAMHKPNESVSQRAMFRCMDMINRVVERF